MKESLPKNNPDVAWENKENPGLAVESPVELATLAAEEKIRVDQQISEIASVGSDIGFDSQKSLISEADINTVKQELQKIDEQAEAIGIVAKETIDSIIKDERESSMEVFMARVRSEIEIAKETIGRRIVAFQADRKERSEDKAILKETVKKLKIIEKNPTLKQSFDNIYGYNYSLDYHIPDDVVDSLRDYDLSSLKLFANNPYVNISEFSRYGITPEAFNQIFQPENLKAFADFCPNAKKVDMNDLKLFVFKIKPLPKPLFEYIEKHIEYAKHKYPSWQDEPLRSFMSEKTIDVLQTYATDELAILQRLIDDNIVSLIGYNTSEIISGIKLLGERAKYLNSEDVSSLGRNPEKFAAIHNLPENEFLVLRNIQQTTSERKSKIGLLNNLEFYNSTIGLLDSLELYNLIKELGGAENVQNIFEWARVASHEGEGSQIAYIIEQCNERIARYIYETPEESKKERIDSESARIRLFSEKMGRLSGHLPALKDLVGRVGFEGFYHLDRYTDDFEADPKKTVIEQSPVEFFQHYRQVADLLTSKDIVLDERDRAQVVDTILKSRPGIIFEPNEFPLDPEANQDLIERLIVEQPYSCYHHFGGFKKYLEVIPDVAKKQAYIDKIFDNVKSRYPDSLLYQSEFPLTPEQDRFVSLIRKIKQSQSRELKNMADDIASIAAKESSLADAKQVVDKIEKVFIKNNIPFIGKQFKIFEILYPNDKLETAIQSSFVPSLKESHSNNARRLIIFKDLLRANFDSFNTNLEQYLLILQDGETALEKFESGQALSEREQESLQSFLKKINTLSESVGRQPLETSGSFDEQSARDSIAQLRKLSGVKEGETIIQRFEKTFLQRIGVASFADALNLFESKRQETDRRNREYAASGQIKLEAGDLIKGFQSEFIDTVLDRGIFSPEFIGADSQTAKDKAKQSDATPFDTDMIVVGDRTLETIATSSHASKYGDLMLIMKDRGQFTSGEIELVDIQRNGPDHRGIRTGFGSSYIEGLITRNTSDQKMEEVKFSIARKGFYIPMTDWNGSVIFPAEEYEQYRKIFSGIEKYHGDAIQIDSKWQTSPYADQIRKYAQTEESIEAMDTIRHNIFKDVAEALKGLGIPLHEGKYAETILGAGISDTGSTGRGSALDEDYDFDFAIKLDDSDWDKHIAIADTLSKKYRFKAPYEQTGMKMYRSDALLIDGKEMSIDIGFVKKSDVEAFDTNTAIGEKYDWIKQNMGEQAYLDVMTNIRFAKKTLKDAGCYKKGSNQEEGQQGGFGGIGVEHWVLQHNGDAIEAFRAFYENAYQQKILMPFGEFKKKYKIFSAGENIRNHIKAENFVNNMNEDGYKKMAELAKEITLSQ